MVQELQIGGTSAVGAWRAAAILMRLRFRQQLNQLGSIYRFRKASAARHGTARKKTGGRILTVLIGLGMLFNFFNLSHQSMANMEKRLGSVEVYKEVRRGWLGVQTGPVTAELADRLGLKPPRGALITGLAEAGPAKPAGLQSGDVILRIDGKAVGQPRDVSRIVTATPVDKLVKVVVIRDGREQQTDVKVGVLPEDARPSIRRIAPEPGSVLAPGVLRGAIFMVTLLFLSVLFLALAGRDITRPEWDLEWLATLPLPLSAMLSSRLIERALTNSMGFILLIPFLSVLAWECGYRWTALPLGLAMTVALLFVAATVQTLFDTGLRLSVAPARLRNLHALISAVAALPLLLAMSMAIGNNSFVFGWVDGLPGWTTWSPAGLAVRALASQQGGATALWSIAVLGEVCAIVGLGYWLLRRQLRDGVVATGAREAAARLPRPARAGAGAAPVGTPRTLLPPVARRELLLLARDRSFMTQTLLVPVIMVGAQVLVHANSNILAGAVDNPANLAAIAFAVAAFTLMSSAFQTLNAEGQALWILYCVPQSLESILRQKATWWAVVATIYPLAIFAIAIAVSGTVSLQLVGLAAIVLIGVPIFAVIASALGVFACDPLAAEVEKRVRPTYLYVYLTLASLYVYAVYASTLWQRAGTIVLTALLAAALWQKARDHLDYLLDPTASPPARVSVSDGMIAALMFFAIQGVVAILVHQVTDHKAAPGTVLWIAFCTAGAVTWAVMRLVYWRARTEGVPRLLGNGLRPALAWAVAGGALASLIGVAYLAIVTAMHVMPESRTADRTTMMVLVPLVVLAAPLFEEFIFRGLIFGGLRRSFGLWGATLASAAIFAIVHPPVAVVPVFWLGICAALVYERTRMLAAPMLVHAIYNAAVVGFQWSVLQ